MRLNTLIFSRKNAKVKRTIIFNLPAGWSCPFAKQCLAKADKKTGKISIGKDACFRCYAVSQENLFKVVRNARWHNFNLLKGKKANEIVALLDEFVSKTKFDFVRIHESGDFFSQSYFDAWCEVAYRHPFKTFYAYTKAIPFWVKRLYNVPSNLHLTASLGGKYDSLAAMYKLPTCRVVYSEQEAKDLGLEIDHDDSHARKSKGDFAVLIHGTQNPNTEAARAWYKIMHNGRGGYKGNYFACYKTKKAKKNFKS